MKLRNKNIVTNEIIVKLEEKGRREKKPIFIALAKELNRPRRVRFEVNLSRINHYAKDNDHVIVPGVVLGQGTIEKAVNVAAFRFSGKAREMIEGKGGKCLSFDDLLEHGMKGKIRIMG
jgi:large subunit ribosomal protein L18e